MFFSLSLLSVLTITFISFFNVFFVLWLTITGAFFLSLLFQTLNHNHFGLLLPGESILYELSVNPVSVLSGYLSSTLASDQSQVLLALQRPFLVNLSLKKTNCDQNLCISDQNACKGLDWCLFHSVCVEKASDLKPLLLADLAFGLNSVSTATAEMITGVGLTLLGLRHVQVNISFLNAV